MEGLVFLIGVIGNVISVLMFLSPVSTFVRIVRKKSTEEFESFPYICALLNSSLWTYYGVTKPDSYLVATVNGFGVVVEIIYVAFFLTFAPPLKRGRTALMFVVVNIGVFAAAVCITYFAMGGETRIDAIGYMASALNIIMYGSPLAAMKRVVTTKSVEYMPFLLSFFFFLNGGFWTFYALLAQDLFLGVPNAIGFLLGTLQLVLYAIYTIYPKKSNVVKEGSQTEHLLPSHGDGAQC
ncbi:hypothetical protein ACJIZ3_000905 [Penstemon smallii]|uniref:Bidirectional sugar transporter SWEET n=1 Tax=Penstemon smallii TaxID=265156 RepID=A0ABD3U553_9LAMI